MFVRRRREPSRSWTQSREWPTRPKTVGTSHDLWPCRKRAVNTTTIDLPTTWKKSAMKRTAVVLSAVIALWACKAANDTPAASATAEATAEATTPEATTPEATTTTEAQRPRSNGNAPTVPPRIATSPIRATTSTAAAGGAWCSSSGQRPSNPPRQRPRFLTRPLGRVRGLLALKSDPACTGWSALGTARCHDGNHRQRWRLRQWLRTTQRSRRRCLTVGNLVGPQSLLRTAAHWTLSWRDTPRGTYLVNLDIRPGRYRITDPDGGVSYFSRLDANGGDHRQRLQQWPRHRYCRYDGLGIEHQRHDQSALISNPG